MSLPNSLTLLRIFFVPLLVALLLTKGPNMDLWAVAVFIIAALTDLLDGYLARRNSQVSRLGILLDPIADKLLTSAAFISLVELHLIPAWIVVIIIGREFAVSGLRSIASAEGVVIAASELGKTKMVFEVIAITVIALVPRFPRFDVLGQVLLWLVVWFALHSAVQYFWSYWRGTEPQNKQAASPHMVVIQGGEAKPEAKKKDVATHRG
ncbi:MAG: CDP-diacylglycerol--glycerol-3-phosphate 3-phosphatidyltransferase [Candidatus Acidiferrales bacterium]